MRSLCTSTLLASFLLLSIVQANTEFTLLIDEEEKLIRDGQMYVCSDTASHFRLIVTEGSSEEIFRLYRCETRTSDCSEGFIDTFSIDAQLFVSIDANEISGIDSWYKITSDDTSMDIRFEILKKSIYETNTQAIDTIPASYPTSTAAEWISDKYPELIPTPFGLELPASCTESDYSGSRFTHLFFDQYGNSLCSVVPQGIPGRQYVVHVVYLHSADSEPMDFLVNQTAGEYLDSYVLRNSGYSDPSSFIFTGSNGENKSRGPQYCWTESVTCLNTSTTDIQIEISGIVYQQGLETAENSILVASRSIHMTPTYHGSLDIGLVNSTLSDPEYSLVMQTDSVGLLRISDDGNRGMVTVMATMYSSPVIWIQSLFDKEIPAYKLYGRNFLDDHKWYQRFYPTVGLELGSSAMESFFMGLNFEFARGGNLFGGIHYGKVSRMNLPEGFIEGQTPMSEEEFNLLLEEEWDIGMAFGLTLDLKILTNLIGL
ncbi:MAG: hypothetical protein KAR44_07695 [Candidatus Aegiribacteria sp.]|nr:hypothetical protein [Candidatus Aegiribacteria sp.]